MENMYVIIRATTLSEMTGICQWLPGKRWVAEKLTSVESIIRPNVDQTQDNGDEAGDCDCICRYL